MPTLVRMMKMLGRRYFRYSVFVTDHAHLAFEFHVDCDMLEHVRIYHFPDPALCLDHIVPR